MPQVADENDNRDGGDSKGAAAGGSPVPVDDFEIPAAAAKEGSAIWLVPGVDHVDAFLTHPDEYVDRVSGYFDSRLR